MQNYKKFLSIFLCVIVLLTAFALPVTAAHITIPTDGLQVPVGEPIYPSFSIDHDAVIVYSYTVQNSSGSVIASKTFESHSYANGPIYGSFTIPKAGTYTITWKVGGWSLIAYASGYVKKANNRNVRTYSQTFKATGSAPVPSDPTANFKFRSQTFVYDGTPKCIYMEGVPAGVTVEYGTENTIPGLNSSSSPKEYTNAGSYKVTAYYQIDANSWRVYNATLTILPREVTITNLAAADKVYDGTTNATITSYGELGGILDGDEVALSDTVRGEFASANAGESVAVLLTEDSLTGRSSKNYTGPKTLFAKITPAPLTIKAKDQAINIGYAIPELTYEITEGTLFGDDKISGSLAVDTDGKTAGNYAITQGTLSAGSNYATTFVPGKLSVTGTRPPADIVDFGTCGENGSNVTWTLSNTGHLILEGSGATQSFFSSNPWASYRSDIVKVTIRNGVTSIGQYAFSGCTNLTSVSIPGSVTVIENSSFIGCTKLASVTIPDGVTSIGGAAFSRCSSLTSITIPSSVTSLRLSAFSQCTGLTDVYYHGTKADWNNIVIDGNYYGLGSAKLHCLGDIAPGDINCDGSVTTKDVTTLRRAIAGGYGIEIADTMDLNDDGVVTTKDVTFLRRYIAGGYGVEL